MRKIDVILTIFLVSAVIFVQSSALNGTVSDDLRKISGTVTDSLGRSMPGVSVVVKGTTTGMATNVYGKYDLEVPENAILVFSFLGHLPQEIVVKNQDTINVVMKEDWEMLSGTSEGLEPANPVFLPIKQNEKAVADNAFAFKMFREVSKLKGDNTFFSPFSLNMALGMLYNGVSGRTREEMVKALGITNLSESEINGYYQMISQALLNIDPTTDLIIANSIWYRNTLAVKNTFIETSKTYFNAEVQALDFKNPNAANLINQWCADKTKNRINHIMGSPIPNDMMMTLINALYFKSKWQKEKRFDKEKTKWDDFTKADNQKIKVNLMEQTTSLPYYEDDYLQCVELPYGNKAFSMIAVLPSENRKIDKLIDHLATVQWQDITRNMKEERVWLKLPRFKIECEIPLNQPVMNLGMKRIFNEGKDFELIANANLKVSEIKQKTFVEVNEEGTEAAAATALIIVAYGVRKANEPVQFFADRPFLFLIREKSSGVILFIGRVDEPKE